MRKNFGITFEKHAFVYFRGITFEKHAFVYFREMGKNYVAYFVKYIACGAFNFICS